MSMRVACTKSRDLTKQCVIFYREVFNQARRTVQFEHFDCSVQNGQGVQRGHHLQTQKGRIPNVSGVLPLSLRGALWMCRFRRTAASLSSFCFLDFFRKTVYNKIEEARRPSVDGLAWRSVAMRKEGVL